MNEEQESEDIHWYIAVEHLKKHIHRLGPDVYICHSPVTRWRINVNLYLSCR